MSDFWANRKAAVQAEARAEELAQAEALQAAQEAKLEERPDEDLLQEAGLPEPEALESPEAVREFLKAELPQRLKTRALRHLWRMNPVLANLDGLVDYGDDFTDSATVVENLQTVYQVGKGMFVKLEEMVAEALETEDEQEADPSDFVAEHPAAPIDLPEPAPVAAALVDAGPDPQPLPATSRRMRFHFEA